MSLVVGGEAETPVSESDLSGLHSSTYFSNLRAKERTLL